MIHAKSAQICGIDVLRFVAASLVASLHLWGAQIRAPSGFAGYLAASAPALAGGGGKAAGVAFIGAVGVQIFFTISGFVIVYSARDQSSCANFLYKRFLRLAPTLWVCTLISAALAVAFQYYSIDEAIARSARSFVIFPAFPKVDDVVWTLDLEVVFYLCIAAAVASRRRDAIKLVAYLLTAISLAYWGGYYGFGCAEGGRAGPSAVCALYANPWFYKSTSNLLAQHGSFFAVGMFLWVGCCQKISRADWIVALIAVLVCMSQLNWTSSYYFNNDGDVGAPQSPVMMIGIWLAATASMGLSIVYHEQIGRALSGCRTLVRIVGLSTYPLYLLHGFVGGAALAAARSVGLGPFAGFIAALCVASAVAAIVAVQIEPRVNAAIRRLVQRSRIFRSSIASERELPPG